MKTDRRTLRNARHEAAHAFVAEYVGLHVTKLELAPPRTRNQGYCHYDRRRKIGRLRQAIIAMAGTIAEQKWHRLGRYKVSSGDYASIAKHFSDSDLTYIRWMSRQMVNAGQKEIEALARELVERDLSGVEVRKIFRRVRPGRWRR